MRIALMCLVVLAFVATATMAQAVSLVPGVPYCEDFNSNTAVPNPTITCPTTVQQLLNNGWTNLQGELPTGNEWSPDNGGTGSGGTGPSVDADGSPTGIYLFTETSGSCSGGDVAIVESPLFDVSNLPSVGFELSYHLFGAAQGSLHVDLVNVTQATTMMDIIPPVSGNLGDTWFDTGLVNVGILLTSFADQFRIQIRGISGTSFTSDMAIDNFKLREIPPNDVAIQSIDAPGGSVAAFAPVTVSVTIANAGTTTETMIPIEFDVDGGGLTQEMYVGSIAPGGTDTFTFAAPAGFTLGANTLNVRAMLGTDGNPSNDALSQTVTGYNLVSSFPYCEDFEIGDGGFVAAGTLPSWAYGTPAGPVINAAASGASAWVTNLIGDHNINELSTLTSPIYDLTSVANPVLSFSIFYETESCCDETWVEVTTDGTNWTKVDSGGGSNWYNDTFNQWWDGTNGGWLTATDLLVGTGGQSSVQVRFVFASDFSIQNDGVGIDDVKIVDLATGGGQAPQAGIATLDVNNATEVNGFAVGSGLAGPYSSTIVNGSTYDITMTGEANQPVVFFIGLLSVGALPIPPFGTVDIDLNSIQVLGNGQNGTLIDSLFLLDGTGTRVLNMLATPALAGAVISMQTINFHSVAIIGCSNAVTANF